MRIAYTLIILVLATLNIAAQSTPQFNYQGVVLNTDGSPLANEEVTVQLEIVGSGFSATETAMTTLTGSFSMFFDISSSVDFSNSGQYQLRATITTSEGSTTTMAPIAYMPLAIYALEADKIKGIETIDESNTNELQTLSIMGTELTLSNGNTVNLPTGGGSNSDADADPNNEIQEPTIDEVGNNVIIGLTKTGSKVEFNNADADSDPQNELQSLSINGTQLTLSNGNTVNLPTGGGANSDADADPNNEIQEPTIEEVGNNIVIGLTKTGSKVEFNNADADSDPNNELQNWSNLPGIPSQIADGVDDVNDADADPTNELQSWSNLPGIPSQLADGIDNVDDADSNPQNELQTLSINGTELTLSNGNTVNLPTGGGSNADADADPNNEIQEPTIDEVGDNVIIGLTKTGSKVEFNNADADSDPTNELQNWSNLPGIPSQLADGVDDVNDADSNPQNELQTLSINGTELSLSNGNTVNLPSEGGDDADADPTNELQEPTLNVIGDEILIGLTKTGTEILFNRADGDSDSKNELQEWSNLPGIPSGLADGVDNVDDADSNPQNELQTLSLNGTQLTLSNGNTVSLPSGGDDADADPTNELQSLVNLSDEGTPIIGISDRNSINLTPWLPDNSAQNELQSISLSGNTLTLSDNGGSVDLSGLGSFSLWQNDNSDIYYNNGNVGIGTALPKAQLDVEGMSELDGIEVGFSNGTYSIISPIGFPLNVNGQTINRFGDVLLTNGIQVGNTSVSQPGMMKYENGELLIYGNFCSVNLKDNPSKSALCWATVQTSLSVMPFNFNNSGDVIFSSGASNVGIGTSSPDEELHVVGDILATDDLTTGDALIFSQGGAIRSNGNGAVTLNQDWIPTNVSWDLGNNNSTEHWDDVVGDDFINFSDKRLKKNIKSRDTVLDKLLALNPVVYQYIETHNPDNRTRNGLIAQDVMKIFPEVVISEDVDIDSKTNQKTINKSDYLSMNYIELIPIIIKGVQEQQEIIDLKTNEIELLRKEIELLKAAVVRLDNE